MPAAYWRRGLALLVDYGAATHARALVLLLLVCLLAFLPGATRIPPVDRDEVRYAQSAREMIDSGNYVDIRLRGEAQYRKPAGIYWLQAAAVQIGEAVGVRDATRKIALYRAPSLVGATGAVMLTYWAALAFVSRRGAILAALMLAASLLLGGEARLAKTDAMLLLCSVAAFGAMAHVYLGAADRLARWQRKLLLPATFWLALGGGAMLKGPAILLFVGLAALVLAAIDRTVRWIAALRPLLGIPLFCILVLPWFVLAGQRGAGAYFGEALVQDMLARAFGMTDSLAAPPGVFALMFFVTFWPASILAGLAVPAVWRARHYPATRFLLAWLVPAWLLLELVINKQPHFVLPLYPAVAILIAGCVDARQFATTRWMERGLVWWFVVPAVAGSGAIVALMAIEGRPGWIAWPFVALSAVFGFRAWWLYRADGVERSLLRACAASILLAVAVYGVILPAMRSLFPAAAIARSIADSGCERPEIAAAGYQEPSLVFLTDTQTHFTDAQGAAEFLRGGDCRFAIVEQRLERLFARRAEAIGVFYAPGTRVSGINLASARRVNVTVYYTPPNR